MSVPHRVCYLITILLAMILGIVALGINSPLTLQRSNRTPKENAELAFSVIGWVALFIAALLLLILFCACGDQYFTMMIVILILVILALISYIIAASLLLQFQLGFQFEWSLAAFWVSVVAVVCAIVALVEDFD